MYVFGNKDFSKQLKTVL